MSKSFLTFTCCILLVACISNKVYSDYELSRLGREWFGAEVRIIRNRSNTFALMLDNGTINVKSPSNALNYGIIDVKVGKMLFRESLYNGDVSWKNDTTVLVHSKPGVRSKLDEQNRKMSYYTIDVSTLRKNYCQDTK